MGGTFRRSFSKHRLSIHIAMIFLSIDKRMIGRRFPGGPAFFPGFCRGISIPSFTSDGYIPVSAISLNISAIPLHNSIGPYLIISALKSSIPAVFPFFRIFTAY